MEPTTIAEKNALQEDQAVSHSSSESEGFDRKQDLAVELDDVLGRKMFLINNALDEIGFTWYHLKLFLLAGFGYSVDSQLEVIQSSVRVVVDRQFGIGYPISTEIFYVGLILGSIFWGFGSDIIGRKISFNLTLLSAALFGIVTGGMNSYATYCLFMGLNAFSVGGNIATDVTIFLEFSPSKFTWLTTLMAFWWGVGQMVASCIGWAFVPNFSCLAGAECLSSQNRGWRYCWYTNSAMVLVLGLIRLLIFNMDETPKFLIANGRDEEAAAVLQGIAKKYNRKCSLTAEDLLACGEIKNHDEFKEGYTIRSISKSSWSHAKMLFQTRKIAYSSTLIFVSWFLIGLAYNTYFNFLYIYIALHGGNTYGSVYVTYRNTAISIFVGMFGPLVAAYLITIRWLGRKGTMAIGTFGAMAILFGYTTVRTQSQDLAFASMSFFFVNIYYACLYAYTPEVFPAIARTTGCVLGLASCRIASTLTPVIYYYGSKSGSAVPIWVCGAIIGFLGILSLLLPFEPTRYRSV